ncbi:MAG: Asp-tRNA(Asn)/Glu-tRNA(Gln) amidotransferase subunit GatB [bacterium]
MLEKFPDYKAVIGIEVHTQLKTKSKIYCSCSNKFGDKPNTNICVICAGHPGTLPVLNKKVVDFAIMLGLATNCKIQPESDFARKHYIYPDTPKNYQITQGENPICRDGFIPIEIDDNKTKKIHLERIHMEEDAGKMIHGKNNKSLIDLNRSGTPLLEIVSKPDMNSADEARKYLIRLHSILRYLDISDANMDEGSFRADVNVSVRKKNETKLGTKVEIKNVNSFKFVAHAIEYEIERQIKKLQNNEKIKQETRTWDTKEHKTVFMRSKEEAQDYRYFTDPDMPVIDVDQKWINEIKKQIPELPHEKINRFQKNYSLSYDEASIMSEDVKLAVFFEQTVKIINLPKQICNWLLRDVLGYLKAQKITLEEAKITPQNFAQLIQEIDNGSINTKIAQEVFETMAKTGKSPIEIIKEKGLEQVSDEKELEKIVLKIINDNPDQKAKYLSGNDRLIKFFVGLAMKETKGKGNPVIIQKLYEKHLK